MKKKKLIIQLWSSVWFQFTRKFDSFFDAFIMRYCFFPLSRSSLVHLIHHITLHIRRIRFPRSVFFLSRLILFLLLQRLFIKWDENCKQTKEGILIERYKRNTYEKNTHKNASFNILNISFNSFAVAVAIARDEEKKSELNAIFSATQERNTIQQIKYYTERKKKTSWTKESHTYFHNIFYNTNVGMHETTA